MTVTLETGRSLTRFLEHRAFLETKIAASADVKAAIFVSENGRGERIRTSDPHNPIVVRYQAALRPDVYSASKGRRQW